VQQYSPADLIVMMMVVPALALPSWVAGAAFLVMFLVGTVVAMGSYTVFIGSCSQALKDRIPRITEKRTHMGFFLCSNCSWTRHYH
jgi:sulfite exporter TauE/SafE